MFQPNRKMLIWGFSLLLAGLADLAATTAASFDDVKAVVVEEVRNSDPQFMVRIQADHPDHVYEVGETMNVSVVSEKAGYLYLIYVDATGEASLLYPNKYQKDNRIQAGRKIPVPSANDNFRLRVGEPTGEEILKAVVSLKPLTSGKVVEARNHFGLELGLRDLKAVFVEGTEQSNKDWAEHAICIRTVPKDQRQPKAVKRLALCIGISEYKDSRIRPLTTAHKDAINLAQALKRKCNFDDVQLLTNSNATLTNIRAGFARLVNHSKPGDEIVIFWTGHGSTLADTGGDEQDGVDELVNPYDTDMSSMETIRNTMVSDDLLGRWIQDLDGRRVVFIAGTCFSGGLATNEKRPQFNANGFNAGAILNDTDGFDLAEDLVLRVKDIGQRDAAVLAASSKSQSAWEQNNGPGSFLGVAMQSAFDRNSGPLTLNEFYNHVRASVDARVAREVAAERLPSDTKQTCVLISDLTAPFFFIPKSN